MPSVSEASVSVIQALQQCHESNASSTSELSGRVRVQGSRTCRIPAGVMKLVGATCSDQYSGRTVLFEPPDSGLPAGLLATPAIVQVRRGTVYVPVVNVSFTEVVLYPRVSPCTPSSSCR